MTKAQIREHKQGNQRRKAAIMHAARNHPEPYHRAHFASLGAIQDGKYSR